MLWPQKPALPSAPACSPGPRRRSPAASRSSAKSPLTGTWADSNSGGSVAAHLRRAGFDALLVRGKAEEPTLLCIRDDEVVFEPAGELWGEQIPEAFTELKKRYGGKRDVGVSAIGPAGEQQARLASVMNDRYHAFGRQGLWRHLRLQEPQGHRGERHR